MPTNLPPNYYKAEDEFRSARTNEEKIAWLEEMYSLVPKHKGTDHLRANLRRRLSKLKKADESRKGGTGRQVSPYHIDVEGPGQIVLVGAANTGKSSLVRALTNAEPEVASYPFSTWGPTPGMMLVDNVQIQLIDTPPINGEHIESELINMIYRADMLLLVMDLQTYPIEQMEETLAILDQRRIIPEYKRQQREGGLRLRFIPILGVVNKVDDESFDGDFEVLCELAGGDFPLIPVSAKTGRNLDQLRQAVFDKLNIIRVYSRPPGKEPDFSSPFVMKKGGTVEKFAGKVHKDFLDNLKSARVWGSSAFDGQMVSRDYVLQDGDV
ncbi:MAG: GTPase, partial [Chloroflexota bacterium]|nr:GTPase [Chloroflexota bacterium]